MQDPHGELTKQNVLIVRGDVGKTASEFRLTIDQVEAALDNARQKLWERRLMRPRPHLDNKMITAWNGLSVIMVELMVANKTVAVNLQNGILGLLSTARHIENSRNRKMVIQLLDIQVM